MRKLPNVKDIILLEVILSFFLGSMPLLFAYHLNPELNVVGELNSHKFDDSVVLYAIYLFVLYLIAWVLNRFWFKPNDGLVRVVSMFHRFTYQIGFSVLVIYRALVGIIPAALGILIYEHGITEGSVRALIAGAIMVIASLYMCVSLSVFKEKSKPQC